MAPAQRKSATEECSNRTWGLRTPREGDREGNWNILVGHGGVNGGADGTGYGL
jgi:hypothetical protein